MTSVNHGGKKKRIWKKKYLLTLAAAEERLAVVCRNNDLPIPQHSSPAFCRKNHHYFSLARSREKSPQQKRDCDTLFLLTSRKVRTKIQDVADRSAKEEAIKGKKRKLKTIALQEYFTKGCTREDDRNNADTELFNNNIK